MFGSRTCKTGAGFRVTSDRPVASMSLWSIRSVISMEPFVDVEHGAWSDDQLDLHLYLLRSPQ